MPAYCMFDVREIVDSEKMEAYRRRVSPTVERHGGRYVAIGGPFDVVEEGWSPVFPVVIEFPDLEAARRWYDSEDYRELKALRREAAKSGAVFIGGL